MLETLRERLDENLAVSLRGKRLRLAASGALRGVAREKLQEALAELTAPCELVLESEDPSDCGDDHVVAVNLTRPMDPCKPGLVEQALQKVCQKYPGAADVKVTHFNGGPCEGKDLMCCIVLGGAGKGWTIKY